MENETALTPNERIAVDTANKIGLKMFDVNDRKSLLSLIKWLSLVNDKFNALVESYSFAKAGPLAPQKLREEKTMTESIYGAGSGSRTND